MTMAMQIWPDSRRNFRELLKATEPSGDNIRKNSDCWIRGIHGILAIHGSESAIYRPSSFYLKDLKMAAACFLLDRSQRGMIAPVDEVIGVGMQSNPKVHAKASGPRKES